jgi:hypothetical protein
MSDNTKDLLIQIKSNTEGVTPALIKLSEALDRVDKALEKVGKQSKSTSDETDKAGKSLDRFHRHAVSSAGSCTTFTDVLKLASSEMGKFSFNTWIAFMNTTLWSGMITGAVATVNKFVETGTKFAEMEAGFRNIAAAAGEVSDVILTKVKVSTMGLLTTAEIMKSWNTAISLGIKTNSDGFAVITGAAVKMSKVMGTDVTYALNSLSTGLARQSIRVLDNIGVTFKQAQAYEWYANEIHKTVKAMTAEEKQAGFVAYAIKMLEENAKKSGDSITSLGQSFKQSTVLLQDAVAKTMAYVVTSNSAQSAGEGLRDMFKELSTKIWENRERIREVVTNLVTFGEKVFSAAGSVAEFIFKYRDMLMLLAEVAIIAKVVATLHTLKIAIMAVHEAQMVQMAVSSLAKAEQAQMAAALTKTFAGTGTLAGGFRALGASMAAMLSNPITWIAVLVALSAKLIIASISCNDLTKSAKDLSDLKFEQTNFERWIDALGANVDFLKTNIMNPSKWHKIFFDAGKAANDGWNAGQKISDTLTQQHVDNLVAAQKYANKFQIALTNEMGTLKGVSVGLDKVLQHSFEDLSTAPVPAEAIGEFIDRMHKETIRQLRAGLPVGVGQDFMRGAVQSIFDMQEVKKENPKTPTRSAEDILGLDLKGLEQASNAIKEIFKKTGGEGMLYEAAMHGYASKVEADFKKFFPNLDAAVTPLTTMIEKLSEGFHKSFAQIPKDFEDVSKSLTVIKTDYSEFKNVAAGSLDDIREKTKLWSTEIGDGKIPISLAEITKAMKDDTSAVEAEYNAFITLLMPYKDTPEAMKLITQVTEDQRKAIDAIGDSYTTTTDRMTDSLAKTKTAFESAMTGGEKLVVKDDPAAQLALSLDLAKTKIEETAGAYANWQLAMGDFTGAQDTISAATDELDRMSNSWAGVISKINESSPMLANFMLGVTSGFKSMSATMADIGKDAVGALAGGFTKFFTSVITGTKTIGQAFKDLGKALLAFVVEALVKMAAQWLLNLIIAKLVGKAQHAQELGTKPAQLGVNAAASVAAIPYVGWAMAPAILAAYTAMGVAALAPGMAAKTGWWEIPGGPDIPVPATLHGGEMVVQQPQAEKIREFVDKTTGEGGQSQVVHLNFNIGNGGEPIIMADNEQMGKFAGALAGHITPHIQRHVNRGTKQLDAYNLRS